MTDTIPATTDQGTGLILPVAKALTHVMIVHSAITRDWPLAPGDAVAELQDALTHMESATLPQQLMTDDAYDTITHWRDQIRVAINANTTITDETPLNEAVDVDVIREIARQSWQMLTAMDREFTGLTPAQAEPGRLP